MTALLPSLLCSAVLMSVAGSAWAADKITLSCSGTLASKESNFEGMPVGDQSLVIDLDQGSVTGSLGDFTIFKVSETSIAFTAEPRDPKVQSIIGGVDRVSGFASLAARLDDTHLLYVYQLNCKLANPLF